MQIFRVRFQYNEQGMGGFSIKFEAWDADDAMRLALIYADESRVRGCGEFFPVGAEVAFSMTERDLAAMDTVRRLSRLDA